MKCPCCGKEMKSKVRDYEYVESGLKNVVLKNIRVHECKACGEVLPEIQNVKQIHKWIAEYLLKKQGSLTGEEFRFLRKAMGRSAKETADRLAVNPVTISRWENNKEKIGPQSDRLLRMAFVLDPNEAQLFAAVKLLELARATLWRTIKAHKKPEKIVIAPRSIRQEEIDAQD
jgi:putative zinc finger/helix-turn-helix YgiT family protein